MPSIHTIQHLPPLGLIFVLLCHRQVGMLHEQIRWKHIPIVFHTSLASKVKEQRVVFVKFIKTTFLLGRNQVQPDEDTTMMPSWIQALYPYKEIQEPH